MSLVENQERFSWHRSEQLEVPELTEERIRSQIDKSLQSIIRLQDPTTGLTAAAPEGRRDLKRHMDHWWMRDQAIKVLALSNGAHALFEEKSPQREMADNFVKASVGGMINLLGNDAWQEGFDMDVVTNPYTGIRELRDSKKAPPIHARTNRDLDPENAGEESWVAQNQPDAWGFLFQSVAQSLNAGIVDLDSRQSGFLEQAISYIDRIQPEQLRQVSMWEWGEPGLPPTSSVASVGKGLSDIVPYIESPLLKKRVERRVQRCRDFVNKLYPYDYTEENYHLSSTDLATLVAMGHDALDGTSHTRFLINARKELIDNDAPGIIRYRGDQYHGINEGKGINGEAAWFMGLPYRANIFFRSAEKVLKSGQLVTAKQYYAKGAADLKRSLDIVDMYGYPPELFEYQNGKYVVPTDGSSSHIGWNDAILIQSGARAIKLQHLLENF